MKFVSSCKSICKTVVSVSWLISYFLTHIYSEFIKNSGSCECCIGHKDANAAVSV